MFTIKPKKNVVWHSQSEAGGGRWGTLWLVIMKASEWSSVKCLSLSAVLGVVLTLPESSAYAQTAWGSGPGEGSHCDWSSSDLSEAVTGLNQKVEAAWYPDRAAWPIREESFWPIRGRGCHLTKGQAQGEQQQDVVRWRQSILCVQHQPPRHRKQQTMSRLCPGCDSAWPWIGQWVKWSFDDVTVGLFNVRHFPNFYRDLYLLSETDNSD